MVEENIHATGLVYDGVGILIRGKSGAGKSLLALALLEFANLSNIEAILIGDDRLDLSLDAQFLRMSGSKSIQGKIELFGYGVLLREFLARANVDLVVDIVSNVERMPELAQLSTEIFGRKLPRCPVAKSERYWINSSKDDCG